MNINMQELIVGVCNDMKIKADKYFISINHDISEGEIYGQKNKIKWTTDIYIYYYAVK